MEKINEVKIPEGVDRIAVKQYDDKIVIEFIPEEPKFKEGDFVYEDGRIMIVKNYPNNYYALIYPKLSMKPTYNGGYAPTMTLSSLSFRYATEDEKQLLIDAMEKDGKRWDAEKLIVEDIPQPKFKIGDKVRIKDGISSKTHRHVPPYFTNTMDKFIGKELTVKENSCIERVEFNEDDHGFHFHENWFEPYVEELKKGDLAIFWDGAISCAAVKFYGRKGSNKHYDTSNIPWINAIKFESKEQFEKVLRGEID